MSQDLTPFSIVAPGFYGLNTSESPVDLSANFALTANNCVIDKNGRIASRKGWEAQNSVNADLGTNEISCIGEVVENGGTATIIAIGGGFVFKLAGGVLTKLTYGGGGVAPTLTLNNWKFCQLNGIGMFWQRGYDPIIYDPAVSTTTFRRLSEKAGSAGTVYQCNEAISAYGRVWAVDTATDKQTIVFSDLLTPHIWTGGSSGSLNLVNVWAKGGDEVVAMAAHNNYLFIFGKLQTLVYEGAKTPSTMTLRDAIMGVGCIARDSVQTTGKDVIFLSNDGIRSLLRTIQESSSPLSNPSQNVNHDIIATSLNETDLAAVKSIYSPQNNFYVIRFPASDATYCFDTRLPSETGALRTTTWSAIDPTCFCSTRDGTLYIGKAGYVGKYDSYQDNGSSYRMSYFTTWIDFEPVIKTSILKKALLTLSGITNQTIIFKWGYDYVQSYYSQTTVITGLSTIAEYELAEFGISEFSGTNAGIQSIKINGSGSGKVLQFGFEADVSGYQISIQRIDLYAKTGRLQ